jgi:signal peptidase I
MIPTLIPGEEVWVLRTRRIRPGDIAVFRDPRDYDLILIKRVVRREPAGWWVEGEISGEHLPDSHTFGPVAPRLVLGRLPRGR